MLFGQPGGYRTGDKQDRHRRKQGPSLAPVADHFAEGVSQSRADRKDREHLEEVGQRSRILVRMRRVGIEESAAVSAQFLNHILRSDRSLGYRLRTALERRRIDVRTQIVRHALPDQHERKYQRNWN